MSVIIQNREISHNSKPLIIAEMSANHGQSIEKALKIVDAASKAGADAIKLQTLKPEGITLDIDTSDFFISDESNQWKGQTLHELYQQAYLPWEWHGPIFERAKELGLIAFSTPFDLSAVDFLETLNVPCYKISSAENRDIPLLRKVAKTGKPLIMSTGMASISELAESVSAIREEGCMDLILLKCTCAYPALPSEANLRTIPHLRELFQCEVGISDHSEGIGLAIASIALGARVIEKHFMLSRDEQSLDANFSLVPDELNSLVVEVARAYEALGCVQYGPSDSELPSLKYRRSLYVVEDLRKGDMISERNIRSIRPGYGLEPKYYPFVIGKRAARDLKKGDPVKWDAIY
ncbi:MAG: pseudaminic acid synthase [Gammaproteobacteria bacterium]